MRENKAMGLLLAGGGSAAMGALIDRRTIGSVPFGARYRLIDFILSDMVHAGIWDIGVITRDKYESLMDHLGSGRDWDLSRKDGGLTLLPPFVAQAGSGAYRGELEALFTYRRYIRNVQARFVVLATTDLIGPIDLDAVIEQHAASGADITAVCKRIDDPRDLGEHPLVFTLGEAHRVTDVTVNAPWHGPCDRYLGVMVLKKDRLLELLDELASHNRFQLGRDLLQGGMGQLDIRAFELESYCVKIQNLETYYRASMSLLDPAIRRTLFYSDTPVLTRVRDEAPTKYGLSSSVKNSLLSDGCIIDGTVESSILFRGVKIGRGAVIQNCILMQGTEVAANAHLS
ncbi:MAG: glucose-1-phosphate adenylyltransferase subunit GlgD, partial [Oscillospiraceae bacterium]